MSPAPSRAEGAVLAALAGAPAGLGPAELLGCLQRAGLAPEEALAATEATVARGLVGARGGALELTGEGARALLDLYAALQTALDPSPTTLGMEDCPTVPWLTTVQTHWLNAVAVNYAVDPDALRPLIPEPLEVEVFKGRAWVSVLVSSLREMRPQGLPGLFGVDFHQVSYRAAVRYQNREGNHRRGGYFVRSETDHPVMRAVGNTLTEFKFHHFGLAAVALERDGDALSLEVKPRDGAAYGEVSALFDVREGHGPPEGSRWGSVDELSEPLVACFDAFGVDPAGWVYVLTIDREPWRARFARTLRCSAPYFTDGPLGGGASTLDSVLCIPEPCGYRWRPLRREPFEHVGKVTTV
ncbi:MAG: DUF2071 domain-containing protein [Deltaproteobacteria bacterium]|nr:DUF2071 domain-containing protein [Deltaproteobacteria bacterium]